jgi:hypothetical protein
MGKGEQACLESRCQPEKHECGGDGFDLALRASKIATSHDMGMTCVKGPGCRFLELRVERNRTERYKTPKFEVLLVRSC